jgi:hypothetical protein
VVFWIFTETALGFGFDSSLPIISAITIARMTNIKIANGKYLVLLFGSLGTDAVLAAAGFGVVLYIVDDFFGDITAGYLLNPKTGTGINFEN